MEIIDTIIDRVALPVLSKAHSWYPKLANSVAWIIIGAMWVAGLLIGYFSGFAITSLLHCLK